MGINPSSTRGEVKFLTLTNSENVQKITQNPTRFRSFAVQDFAIFGIFSIFSLNFIRPELHRSVIIIMPTDYIIVNSPALKPFEKMCINTSSNKGDMFSPLIPHSYCHLFDFGIIVLHWNLFMNSNLHLNLLSNI